MTTRRRYAAGLLIAVLAVAGRPTSSLAQDGDDPAAVVHRLFDAMRTRDTVAIRQAFHPEGRLMTAARDRAGVPVVQTATVDAFVRAVTSARAKLDERLSNVEVRVDGGLATVWAQYRFYADSTFIHCGANAFQLGWTADGWKITQVTDTRRQEECEDVGR